MRTLCQLTQIILWVLASKVDMRRYVKDEVDTIQCEVRRYSTGGFQKRWPGMGAQEQDLWFACTLRHAEGLFVITTFLRHSPSNPNALQPDFQHWTPVTDRDTVSTTGTVRVTVMCIMDRIENSMLIAAGNTKLFLLLFTFLYFCGQL